MHRPERTETKAGREMQTYKKYLTPSIVDIYIYK